MGKLGYDDTPVLPGGKWQVHDYRRPQPQVITPGVREGAEGEKSYRFVPTRSGFVRAGNEFDKKKPEELSAELMEALISAWSG